MPRVSGYYRKTDSTAVTQVHTLKFTRQSDNEEFIVNTTSTGAYNISLVGQNTYVVTKKCPGESTFEAVNSPASVVLGTTNIIVIIKGDCNPTC